MTCSGIVNLQRDRDRVTGLPSAYPRALPRHIRLGFWRIRGMPRWGRLSAESDFLFLDTRPLRRHPLADDLGKFGFRPSLERPLQIAPAPLPAARVCTEDDGARRKKKKRAGPPVGLPKAGGPKGSNAYGWRSAALKRSGNQGREGRGGGAHLWYVLRLKHHDLL